MIIPCVSLKEGDMIQIKQTPLQRILILAKVVVYTTKSPSAYCLAW